jgi:hypothetical protein
MPPRLRRRSAPSPPPRHKPLYEGSDTGTKDLDRLNDALVLVYISLKERKRNDRKDLAKYEVHKARPSGCLDA